MTLNFSRKFYDNCLISYQTDHSLPTSITRFDTFGLFRVPDVEKHHLQTTYIDDLQTRIREECEQITPEVLDRVFKDIKRRVNVSLEVEGQDFQQLLHSKCGYDCCK